MTLLDFGFNYMKHPTLGHRMLIKEHLVPQRQPTNKIPATIYTVKKVSGFPVPSRDVTYQTLLGREQFNYSQPGRVW